MNKTYIFLGAILTAFVLVPMVSLAVNYLTVSDSGTLAVNGDASVSGNATVSGSVSASSFISPGDDFDSYSDGDLNSNNGGFGFSAAWSGNTAYDVQGTTVFDGTKAVKVSQASGQEPMISRAFSGKTSGVLHWAQRKDGTDHLQGIALFSGSTLVGEVYMSASGSPIGAVWGILDGGSPVSLGLSFSTNTWYTVDVEFNTITDQYRASINGGAYSTWQDFSSAVSSIDKIQIAAGADGVNTIDGYFDDIRLEFN